VLVERRDQGLGASGHAVGADAEVEVGPAAVAAVARVEDLLACGDGVALVHVVSRAVAVRPLEALLVGDDDPEPACLTAGQPVAVVRVRRARAGGAASDRVDGRPGRDGPVPRGVVVVRVVALAGRCVEYLAWPRERPAAWER